MSFQKLVMCDERQGTSGVVQGVPPTGGRGRSRMWCRGVQSKEPESVVGGGGCVQGSRRYDDKVNGPSCQESPRFMEYKVWGLWCRTTAAVR